MKNAVHYNENKIDKGSVVLWNGGWYSVSAVFKNTVNLTSVFGSKPLHKKVDRASVKEDYDNWYKDWQQSERYQSM